MNGLNNSVILGGKYSKQLNNTLKKYFSYIIEIPENPLVDRRLSGHTDLFLCKTGPSSVLVPINLAGTAIESILQEKELQIRYTHRKQGRTYPEDVIVNVCPTEKYLIYNPKTADETVEEIFSDRQRITVNQGYTGCSVCRVGLDSIITSDPGIHAAAEKAGLNSLQIEPGFIELEGYNCGFIGGASISVNDKLILFTGRIEKHPSYQDIRAFLKNISVDFDCLTDENLFDIGAAVIF